jgi:cobalamin biosynthesis protein CobW
MDHEHDDGFTSIVTKVTMPHTPEQLEKALLELVRKFEIYRIKGFINVPGKPMRMVIQGVGDRFEKHFDRAWKTGEVRATRLVVIGHELEEKRITETLQTLVGQTVSAL